MKEEIIVEKITENLSDMEAATFLSTYDQIVLKGKKAQSLRFANKLLQKFPQWTDKQIAEMSETPLEEVKAIRKQLANNVSDKDVAQNGSNSNGKK